MVARDHFGRVAMAGVVLAASLVFGCSDDEDTAEPGTGASGTGAAGGAGGTAGGGGTAGAGGAGGDSAKAAREAIIEELLLQELNFGVSAYCTRAKVELLRVKGLAFDPDVVVLFVSANDFRNFNFEWVH